MSTAYYYIIFIIIVQSMYLDPFILCKKKDDIIQNKINGFYLYTVLNQNEYHLKNKC